MDKTFYEVALGDWVQTYRLRVITIDDVASERRTLRVRSVTPLALRDK